MYVLEIRYFGVSQPADDLSTEHLVWLTNEQIVADTANFIAGMSKTLAETYGESATRKWLVIGGSYGANAIAWMNVKYPHIADFVVADSPPVLAVTEYW